MSKAVLVIDMPSNCKDCNMSVLGIEPHTGQMCFRCVHHPTIMVLPKETKRPDWCPLRELPEKMQVCGKYPQEDKIVPSYKIGYNACIDELLKGEEG